MRKIFFALTLFLSLGLTTSSSDAWRYGNPADSIVRPLRVGGGGQLTAVDIQCDQGVGACNNSGTTTKVTRADTYGAYAWRTTGTCDIQVAAPCWQQVVTFNSLPDGDPASAYNYCANGRFCAPYEIRIAPSNTNIAYMHFNGYVYRHDNFKTCFVDGAYPATDPRCRWSVTAFSRVDGKPEGNTKFFGPFLAIDPQNSNVVVVGTPASGAFYTTNGGASFSSITLGTACTPTTPSGALQGGGYTFAFDPSSSVIGGITQGLYMTCYGTGVYGSTSGPSASFTLLSASGMPTTPKQIVVSDAGLLYVVASNNVYLYTASTWSVILDGTTKTLASSSIAIDRNNPTHLLVSGGASTAGFYYSTDSATAPTWGNRISAYSRSSTAVPWLQLSSSDLGGTSFANVMFDPAQSNVALVADGISVWSISPARTGTACGAFCFNMTAMAAGIEQLVTNTITSVPGGVPIGSAWDRPTWTFTNPNVYPSDYGPNHAIPIQHNWSVDYSGSYVFEYSYWAGSAASGYSANYGGTGVPADWALFSSQPPTTFPGNIAALSTSDAAILQNGSSLVGQIYTSNNRGSSWTQVTSCAGVPTSGASGWGSIVGINTPNRTILTADKVAGVYYAFNYSTQPGVYKISADGTSCSRMTTANFDPTTVDGYGAMMKAVPGIAGHLFFTAGSQDPDNASQAFWHCTDTGTMSCSSSDSYVTGVTDVTAFGFGAPKPGDTFPALYIYGRVGGDPGWWRGTNLSTTAQWTKLSHYAIGGWLDGVRNTNGDLNHYGKAYIGFQGSGWKYGWFN